MTGGVKLDEPAIDLAIIASIVSSYKDESVGLSDCFIGEVGLTGEVRRVSRIEQRVNEAAKLGFTRIFLPNSNIDGWDVPSGVQLVGVDTIQDALKRIF